MRKLRVEFLMNQQEKSLVNKAAENHGLSLSDYIRRKLLDENKDITQNEERYVYETPAKNKHNYLNIAITSDIYWMLYNFISEQKDKDKMQEFRNNSRAIARKSIVHYGYLKIEKDE